MPSNKYELPAKVQKPIYISSLDGIRAIAILFVLFSHSVIFDQFTWLHNIGIEFGYVGVNIFFVLSGYLITRLLIQEEDRTGSILLSFFYIRRALRLLPALWLYLFIVWLLWLGGLLPGNPWYSFITSLLYIRNIIGHGDATGHLWSLSIEEQFYFLWPVSLVMLPQQNWRRLIIASIVIFLILSWRVYAFHNKLATYGDVYIRTDFRLDSILIGSIISLVERVKPGLFIRFNSSPLISDLWLFTGLILLSCWITIQLTISQFWGFSSTVTSLISGIIIISQCANYDSFGKRFLTLPPLVYLGKISYGVYLWQGLFLGYQIGIMRLFRVFPFSLILSFCSALISYYLLEKPLLRIKDKLRR